MDANIIKEKASRKYAGCNEIQKNITLDIMERLIPKGSIEATTGELYKASIKLLEAGLGNRKSSPVTLVSQKEVYLEENKQDKTANVERDYRSKDTLSKSHRNLKEATTNKIEKEMQKEFFGLMGVDESLSKYGIGKQIEFDVERMEELMDENPDVAEEIEEISDNFMKGSKSTERVTERFLDYLSCSQIEKMVEEVANLFEVDMSELIIKKRLIYVHESSSFQECTFELLFDKLRESDQYIILDLVESFLLAKYIV